MSDLGGPWTPDPRPPGGFAPEGPAAWGTPPPPPPPPSPWSLAPPGFPPS
ncbi:MAG: hypothetical protein JWM05_845, partial [Acidimicrobiales bacterium]|nr:hypothetical protein [Acidimicrobiales bacterium]